MLQAITGAILFQGSIFFQILYSIIGKSMIMPSDFYPNI